MDFGFFFDHDNGLCTERSNPIAVIADDFYALSDGNGYVVTTFRLLTLFDKFSAVGRHSNSGWRF